MDAVNAFGYWVVGTMFAILGLTMFFRQSGRIGLGPVPTRTLEITGLLAKIVGGSIFVGGVLAGLPFILALLSLSSSLTERLPFIGILIMFAGVVFGVLLQSAISLGEYVGYFRSDSSEHNE